MHTVRRDYEEGQTVLRVIYSGRGGVQSNIHVQGVLVGVTACHSLTLC